MKWTDIYQIAEELADTYPEQDPSVIRFTELRDKIMALPHFDDDPNRSGEKVLEAIQQAWMDEIS